MEKSLSQLMEKWSKVLDQESQDKKVAIIIESLSKTKLNEETDDDYKDITSGKTGSALYHHLRKNHGGVLTRALQNYGYSLDDVDNLPKDWKPHNQFLGDLRRQGHVDESLEDESIELTEARLNGPDTEHISTFNNHKKWKDRANDVGDKHYETDPKITADRTYETHTIPHSNEAFARWDHDAQIGTVHNKGRSLKEPAPQKIRGKIHTVHSYHHAVEDLVNKYSKYNRNDSSSPAAPNSSTFRANKSGKIEFAKHHDHHGGYYGFSYRIHKAVKIGGNYPEDKKKEFLEKYHKINPPASYHDEDGKHFGLSKTSESGTNFDTHGLRIGSEIKD